MFICPYYAYCSNMYSRESTIENSYIRALHAAPGAPRVDIYLDNRIFARALPYRNFTKFFSITPGPHRVRVFPAGTIQNPVIDTVINVVPNSIFTLAVTGVPGSLSLFAIKEPVIPKTPGRVNLRIVHLSPDAPNVDVDIAGARIAFNNVRYKEITDYKTTGPGVYTMNVKVAGTNNNVLHVPNIRLLPNRFYTIYIVGLAKGTPSLQALIALDGNTYLKV